MVIKLEGKEHRNGVSKKTGNPYDFYVLHFLAKSKNVEGVAALQKLVDADVCMYDELLVNLYYDLEFDLDGSICAIRPAKI